MLSICTPLTARTERGSLLC